MNKPKYYTTIRKTTDLDELVTRTSFTLNGRSGKNVIQILEGDLSFPSKEPLYQFQIQIDDEEPFWISATDRYGFNEDDDLSKEYGWDFGECRDAFMNTLKPVLIFDPSYKDKVIKLCRDEAKRFNYTDEATERYISQRLEDNAREIVEDWYSWFYNANDRKFTREAIETELEVVEVQEPQDREIKVFGKYLALDGLDAYFLGYVTPSKAPNSDRCLEGYGAEDYDS